MIKPFFTFVGKFAPGANYVAMAYSVYQVGEVFVNTYRGTNTSPIPTVDSGNLTSSSLTSSIVAAVFGATVRHWFGDDGGKLDVFQIEVGGQVMILVKVDRLKIFLKMLRTIPSEPVSYWYLEIMNTCWY